MAKEVHVQAWACEICGKNYLNRGEAEECESSHESQDVERAEETVYPI